MSIIGNKFNHGQLILKKPRVTEKATFVTGNKNPVYTFEISERVNKIMVKQAIEDRFKVTPIKIRIINLPAKRKTVRRVPGVSSAVKKAMVYLSPGQTIDVI